MSWQEVLKIWPFKDKPTTNVDTTNVDTDKINRVNDIIYKVLESIKGVENNINEDMRHLSRIGIRTKSERDGMKNMKAVVW